MPTKSKIKQNSRNKKKASSSARSVFSVRFLAEEIRQLQSEARLRGTSVATLVRELALASVASEHRRFTSGSMTACTARARVFGDFAARSVEVDTAA
jgi:hypothetical protein